VLVVPYEDPDEQLNAEVVVIVKSAEIADPGLSMEVAAS
jgi:hypothetical protein